MYTLRLLCATLMVLLVVANTLAADQDAARPLAKDKVQDIVKGSNDYLIGPEDLLDISVWNNTAIGRTVPVRPDGKISLPLLNDVQAGGLTALELRAVLTTKLAEYIPSPEVSVIGEIKKPGRHELKGQATVLDVLALAEGFGDFASRGKIVVLRPAGETVMHIPFNYNKVLSNNGAVENFFLQPGDIILVP